MLPVMSEKEAQKRPTDVSGCKTHLLSEGKSKISWGGKVDSTVFVHPRDSGSTCAGDLADGPATHTYYVDTGFT